MSKCGLSRPCMCILRDNGSEILVRYIFSARRQASAVFAVVMWCQFVPEWSMGWVDPWVGSGQVGSRFFVVFNGLGWVHYSKSTKI